MTKQNRLTKEQSTLLTKLMVLGTQTALPIELSGKELARLIGVIYRDTNHSAKLSATLLPYIVPTDIYYKTAMAWFEERYELDVDHVGLFLQGQQDIPDFLTYLRCITELHKRRKKYSRILSAQPIPTMLQISPRALIEYGSMQPDVLASWITWRKWFYDLDNRSAQESGYLFEPILAAALGGVPGSAKNSPILRTNDKNKRRQVDCFLIKQTTHEKLAYEFKLRVTIAASGQGRFGEELDFAQDCKNSGFLPVLLVLDPTPNPRLADLASAFRAAGGEAFTGDDAWIHLEDEAGETMAAFIELYVRGPIREISTYDGQLLNFSSTRRPDGNIEIALGTSTRLIARHESAELEALEGADESRNAGDSMSADSALSDPDSAEI